MKLIKVYFKLYNKLIYIYKCFYIQQISLPPLLMNLVCNRISRNITILKKNKFNNHTLITIKTIALFIFLK